MSSSAISSQPASINATLDTLFEEELLNVKKKAKELSTTINWIKTQRKVKYLEGLIGLQEHKSVDVRRKAIAALGEIGNKKLVSELKAWQQNESDRVAWVALEGVIDKLERKLDGADNTPDQTILTVSEALGVIKQLIGTREYTIEGELSEVRPVRNLYFFGLKDKIDVRINCMLVSYNISNIGFALNEGLQVRVRGSFKMSKDSRIYFEVKNISLTGEGELLRNLTLLDQKLQMEGLYDPTRKRMPTRLPERVLLMASPNSAAIKDFTKVLSERRKGISIYFLPIKTQGTGAEFDLLEAFKKAQTIIQKYDIQTAVMTRGGGSQDDLQLFNSENVVRAVHSLNIPIIVAIGHERDVTLSEKVADVRASTPSNAAELVSQSSTEALNDVAANINTINSLFNERKNEYRNVTQLLVQKILRLVSLQIQEAKHIAIRSDTTFFSLINQIRRDSESLVQSSQFQVREAITSYKSNLPDLESYSLRYLDSVSTTKENVSVIHGSIKRGLMEMVTANQIALSSIDQILHLLDPRLNLEKGYAIIKQDKSIITRIKHLDFAKTITIQMFDAEIDVKLDAESKNNAD